MAKLKESLWNTLENLTTEQLETFQWFLKHDDIMEGFSGIPEARLERANRQDTVDRMVQKYGPDALVLTIKILEKISRNDLVQPLALIKNGGLLKSEYETKKEEMEKTKAEIKQMIQERQMKIQKLKHSVELSKKSANRHIADSKQAFGLLLQLVQRSLDNLIEAIEEKDKATQKQAEGFIRELEQEVSELTKRSAEVEKLLQSKDHISVVRNFSPGDVIPPTKNWTEVSIPLPQYGRSVGSAVTQLKEEFNNGTEGLISKAKFIRVQEFAVDVTLDPDTANSHLVLSDDGKQVYCGDVRQNLPDNPKRFDSAPNVLGKESFSSGRFYYEVQVEGKTSWDLGIVKESVSRKGSITAGPSISYWTIYLRNTNEYNASGAKLCVKYPLKKVGVFVDYDKRSVLFFNVDSADIIHSYTDCSFTEKIYPFFSPGRFHRGQNTAPLIISALSNTGRSSIQNRFCHP